VIRDDHRKPLASYSAIEGALARGLLRPSYTTTRDLTIRASTLFHWWPIQTAEK
jgi:hypothetical protein